MAIWTTQDRDEIAAAIKAAALEGYVELSIAGQQVRRYTMDELLKLLAVVQTDLAGSNVSPFGRTFQLVSPGCGG